VRIVSWNVRGAVKSSPAWNYLLELGPDLALVQHVCSVPENVLKSYQRIERRPRTKAGGSQKFNTSILVRGSFGQTLRLTHKRPWLNTALETFRGNLVGNSVRLHSGSVFRTLSVYAPAWRIEPLLPKSHKKELNAFYGQFGVGIYLTDLLWAAMKGKKLAGDIPWIIGGDFNLSETFDTKWGKKPRGNKEFLDAMASFGLVECLRHYNKRLVPTFKHCRGKIEDQIDHLFVSRSLANELIFCTVGDTRRVFGQSLSDHLPIIADFRQ